MTPELLPNLDTFAEAAERASFTAAARALGLTQAAVSQRVQALERELGVPLFRRTGGRVELTDAGRKLHAYARRILDLHREARQEVTGKPAAVAGELVLAASSIPGEHILPAVLAAFGAKYPQVRVRAAVSDSAAVIRSVESGEVSVGLVGRKTDAADLEFRRFASDRMVVVAPPGHALAKKKRVTLAQLAAHPLVLREAGSGLRHSFEKALERAGRSHSELRVALELGSNEAIKEAVRRGAGVTVLSTLAVRKEVAAGRLVAVDVEGLDADREMFVVTDRRRVLPLSARLFVTLLEAVPLPDLTS
jgi:LysR family transcriptional regulator, low CO2-responsive transcriptional regulator